MIKHKSCTRWPDNREVRRRHVRSASYTWRRWEAWVFWFSLKTGGNGLSVVWPQNHYDGFLIWVSKPRSTVWWFGPQNHDDSFLVCASKLMSGWRRCEDTRWHLMTCFTMKQVGLESPSFASKSAKGRVTEPHKKWEVRLLRSRSGDSWRSDNVSNAHTKH
jgi:hypothetical protein